MLLSPVPAGYDADLLLEGEVVIKVPVLDDLAGTDALDVHGDEVGLLASATTHSVVAAGG
ncbi:hypothetical protein ACXZ65_38970 [Streptomyces aculeolatus]